MELIPHFMSDGNLSRKVSSCQCRNIPKSEIKLRCMPQVEYLQAVTENTEEANHDDAETEISRLLQ